MQVYATIGNASDASFCFHIWMFLSDLESVSSYFGEKQKQEKQWIVAGRHDKKWGRVKFHRGSNVKPRLHRIATCCLSQLHSTDCVKPNGTVSSLSVLAVKRHPTPDTYLLEDEFHICWHDEKFSRHKHFVQSLAMVAAHHLSIWCRSNERMLNKYRFIRVPISSTQHNNRLAKACLASSAWPCRMKVGHFTFGAASSQVFPESLKNDSNTRKNVR